MKRHHSALLAAAASALAMMAAPAIAQNYCDDDEIIVQAPHVERHRTGEHSSIGAPVDELVLQRIVTTKDLDLRYDADVDELYRRIRVVAVEACNEVDRASLGAALTTERECIRDAERDAIAQADEMIYYRRG